MEKARVCDEDDDDEMEILKSLNHDDGAHVVN